MNRRWLLPVKSIRHPGLDKSQIKEALGHCGAAIVGEIPEALYECTHCHTLYGERADRKPRCPLVALGSCSLMAPQRQHVVRPAYIVDAPASRLDLLDLGGAATRLAGWLSSPSSFVLQQSRWAARVISLSSPRLQYLLFLTASPWPAIVSEREPQHPNPDPNLDLNREWYQSFGQMARYFNVGFGPRIGHHCLVQCFRLDEAQLLPVEISRRGLAPEPSQWGNVLVEASVNGCRLPSADATTGEALLLVASSNRRIAVAMAEAMAYSLAWRGTTVAAMSPACAESPEIEVVDLSTERDELRELRLDPYLIRRWLGVPNLHTFRCVRLFSQLGYSARASLDTLFHVDVKVPLHRFDVRDPVDLVADLATALGYHGHSPLAPQLFEQGSAPGAPFGKESQLEQYCDVVRQTMIGMRFREVLGSDVVSDATDDDPVIEDNPIYRDGLVRLKAETRHFVLRRHLFTSLLTHLKRYLSGRVVSAENPVKQVVTHAGQPVRKAAKEERGPDHYALFEIADGFERASEGAEDTSVSSRRWLAGLIAQYVWEQKPHSRWSTLFAETQAVVEAVLRENFKPAPMEFVTVQTPLFIPGRGASIRLQGDLQPLGRFGEVDPKILRKQGVDWPVALFELDLTQLYGRSKGTD